MSLIAKRAAQLLSSRAESDGFERLGIKRGQRDRAMAVAVSLYEKATDGRDVAAAKELSRLCEGEFGQKSVDINIKIVDV